MTAPRDEKGRFVSAKPVLHRQVVCDATEWTDEQVTSLPGGEEFWREWERQQAADVRHITGNLTAKFDNDTEGYIHPNWVTWEDPHGPRIEVAVVWAIVAAVGAGLAFVAHLLGAW